ncbi:hypothetical protein PMAYCL1PPCAC_03462, partial [Pristionchus mayeri]
SVINQNDLNDLPTWTIALYVVEKSKADEISYEVYDYVYIKEKDIIPQTGIVTIISAIFMQVSTPETRQRNSITARLAGFDNVHDENEDGC